MSVSYFGALILTVIVIILAVIAFILCLLYVVGVSLLVSLALSEYFEFPAPFRLANTIAAGLLSPFGCFTLIVVGPVVSYSGLASVLTIAPVVISLGTSLFFALLHRAQKVHPRIPMGF